MNPPSASLPVPPGFSSPSDPSLPATRLPHPLRTPNSMYSQGVSENENHVPIQSNAIAAVPTFSSQSNANGSNYGGNAHMYAAMGRSAQSIYAMQGQMESRDGRNSQGQNFEMKSARMEQMHADNGNQGYSYNQYQQSRQVNAMPDYYYGYGQQQPQSFSGNMYDYQSQMYAQPTYNQQAYSQKIYSNDLYLPRSNQNEISQNYGYNTSNNLYGAPAAQMYQNGYNRPQVSYPSSNQYNAQNNYSGSGNYHGVSRQNGIADVSRPYISNFVQESNPFEEEDFLKRMQKGINFDKYDDIPVSCTGENIPPPLTSFSELVLPPPLLACVEMNGFSNPTPIQKYALPCALASRDLMGCAQTGSGKTGAFLIPIVVMLLEKGIKPAPIDVANPKLRRYAPNALILAPTRELCMQIFQSARRLTWKCNIRPVVVYGGCDIKTQFYDLNRGCDILIATPGRLIDILSRGRMSFCNVNYLVIDEADNMLDMGFIPQITQLVTAYDMPDRNNRQTVMFSATFKKEIQQLASEFLSNFIYISIGKVGSASEQIVQHVKWVEESEKFTQLLELLSCCDGLVLIFVQTRRSADMLEYNLRKNSFSVAAIHGDRTQPEREDALSEFRYGRIKMCVSFLFEFITISLVATDVASRGLDIPSVMHVVNYDLPSNIDSYVHRIGRTGRCGNSGDAHSFINDTNANIFKDFTNFLRENEQEVPEFLVALLKKK